MNARKSLPRRVRLAGGVLCLLATASACGSDSTLLQCDPSAEVCVVQAPAAQLPAPPPALDEAAAGADEPAPRTSPPPTEGRTSLPLSGAPTPSRSAPVPACGGPGQACCDQGPSCEAGLGCESGSETCERCAAFSILDLYPGHDTSAARAISADGRWVVGRSRGEGVDDHAVLWDLKAGLVQALGTLPGGSRSIAHALSADGSILVGQGDASDLSTGIVLWRAGAEPEWLGEGEAYATSADGSVVVGLTTDFGSGGQAFRWTRATGLLGLGRLVDGLPFRGYAVSSDGSAIAGDLNTPRGLRAMRWSEQDGLENLGVFEGGDDSAASAISGDGAVVYGLANGDRGAQVFRWTKSTGLQGIVPVRDTYESLPASNASGLVVVGRSYQRAFIWYAATGQSEMLTDRLAGLVPDDWELTSATGVSDDGRVVTGTGQGRGRLRGGAWVAQLGPDCSLPDAATPDAGAPGGTPLGGEPEPAACGAVQQACCSEPSLACASGLGCEAGVCAPCATFRGLGVLAGHAESVAAGLSRDGRVAVGWGRPDSAAPSQALRWVVATGEVEALTPTQYSRAIGTNADGSVVVGYDEISDVQNDAFRWTRDGGWTRLATDASAFKVSADGTSVVGVHPLGSSIEAFRWSLAGGFVGLNAPSGLLGSQALGISADGAVVLGQAANDVGNLQAVSWSAAGLRKLEGFPHDTGTSYASAGSADGSVLVGLNGSSGALPAVFRWTAEGVVRVALGALSDSPPSTNAAGSVVVGTSRGRAFVWEQRSAKARPLHLVWGDLVPSGWLLLEATDVSEDGRVIVGRGRSPERNVEAWVGVLGPQCPGTGP